MRQVFSMLIGATRLIREYVLNCGRIKLKDYKYYIGKNVKIYVSKNGFCDLGKKTWISDNSYFSANEGRIELGYNNFFNANCRVVAMERIRIGDNNLFGPNVVIVDHNHNHSAKTELICKQGYTKKEVIIGSDIWVGANVTICSGVKICDHVVVGANSVVTKSIVDSGVYGGVPARKLL